MNHYPANSPNPADPGYYVVMHDREGNEFCVS